MTLSDAVSRIPAAWPPAAGSDFRAAAALVAAEGFGRQAVTEMPIFVNLGALTLALGSSPVVHRLRPEALDLIDGTDLRSVPREAPALLRSACVIEADGASLFGETTDLGVYQIPDGRYGLLGFTGRDLNGGAFFSLWRPHWAGEDIDAPELSPNLTDDTEGVSDWAREAIRFLLIYGLLLEADRTPVSVESSPRKVKRSVEGREHALGRGRWTIRRVSLTTRPARAGEATPAAEGVREGLALERTRVSGHLRRQAVGARWSERRWIYIEAYEARRWIAPGPRKLIVSK